MLTDGAIAILVNAERQIDEAIRTLVGELTDDGCSMRAAIAIRDAAGRAIRKLEKVEIAAIDRQDDLNA